MQNRIMDNVVCWRVNLNALPWQPCCVLGTCQRISGTLLSVQWYMPSEVLVALIWGYYVSGYAGIGRYSANVQWLLAAVGNVVSDMSSSHGVASHFSLDIC